MIYPDADKLELWGSKYALVGLAAKRAKQIKSGAPILVVTQSRNPLTIALEEIAAGKVTCVVGDVDLPMHVPAEPDVAELLTIPIESEEEAEELEAKEAGVELGGEQEAADVAEEAEEEVEEEDEEEDHELVHDEIWREVLQDESEDGAVVGAARPVDAEEAEAVAPEEDAEPPIKPKRKRRASAAVDSLVPGLDVPEVLADIGAGEDQPEEE